MKNPALEQAEKYAAAVKAVVDWELNVPVWDRDKCREKGYRCDAAVILEETPFDAIDELSVGSRDVDCEFKLTGMTRLRNVFAEPHASWMLCFYNEVGR